MVPRGLEKIVDYIKIRYHNMPMYITENGERILNTLDDLIFSFSPICYFHVFLLDQLSNIISNTLPCIKEQGI